MKGRLSSMLWEDQGRLDFFRTRYQEVDKVPYDEAMPQLGILFHVNV